MNLLKSGSAMTFHIVSGKGFFFSALEVHKAFLQLHASIIFSFSSLGFIEN